MYACLTCFSPLYFKTHPYDAVVWHHVAELSRRVCLLDGDKIAALAAKLVKTLIAKLPETMAKDIKVRKGSILQ